MDGPVKAMALAVIFIGALSSLSSVHAQELPGGCCGDKVFHCQGWSSVTSCEQLFRSPRFPQQTLLVTQLSAEGDQEPGPPPVENGSAVKEAGDSDVSLYRRAAFAVGIGGAYWPNIHRVEPNPAIFDPNAVGSPNAWGISVELSGHGRIYHEDEWDLLIGADLGFISHENAKTFDTPGTTPGTEKSRVLAQMIYITPSVKLYYHTGMMRPFIGAGVGGYFLELAARSERGELLQQFVKKETFGGYLSIGVDIPIKLGGIGLLLRLEDKFHMVDFGSLGTFSPSSGSLTGPINMIQVGFGFVL